MIVDTFAAVIGAMLAGALIAVGLSLVDLGRVARKVPVTRRRR